MFNFLKNLNQANEPITNKIAGEEIVKGEALDYSDGKLVKATTKAKFLAVNGAAADEEVAVVPIRAEDVIEVETDLTLKEGTAYDLDLIATGLADTTVNGVFLVEKVAEGKVEGRFVK